MTLTFPVSQPASNAGKASQFTFFAGQLLAQTFAEVRTTSVLATEALPSPRGQVHLKRNCEPGELVRVSRTGMQLFSTGISRNSW